MNRTKFGDPLRRRMSVGWFAPTAIFVPDPGQFLKVYSDLRLHGFHSDGTAYLALSDPDSRMDLYHTPPAPRELAQRVLESYRSATPFDSRDLAALVTLTERPPAW